MLNFKIVNTNGSVKKLERILTASLDSETDIPADSLVITCPFDSGISKNADRIMAFDEDKLVFKGQIDEIINIKKSGGVITKLSTRSPAAALLDNEAEPITYLSPAPVLIFDRHLKPFGITQYFADNIPFFGRLKIDKGMSHWQVFKNFCKNRYGCEPRISGDGKAYFNGFGRDEIIKFGGADNIEYYSLKENRIRCKIISQVKLKLTEFGTYSSVINNTNLQSRDINRVRYVNAAADNSTVETADKMIEQSNLDSYRLTLECVGCYPNLLGCRAVVDDETLGKADGLRIIKTLCKIDGSGARTTVVLRKEEF